jgi:16S rRNA (adenine1518-N6/adenine1519-N6)-dimethyltransferase
MKGNDIRDRLRELGRKPNKRYGQHFLVDQSVLNAIITAAEIADGDRVLEIGPGMGILTESLVEAGASVVAIEKDRALVRELELRLKDHVRIVEGDALEVDWGREMAENKIPNSKFQIPNSSPWKLVANIPYSITSQIIRKALWSEATPSVIVLLVQREVAERIVGEAVIGKREAGSGKKSASRSASRPTRPLPASLLSLSVMLASSFVKTVRKVPRKCFYPAPDVESSVLKIEPMSREDRLAKWGIDPAKVMSLATRAFLNPRKKMTTTLASKEMTREKIAAALNAAGASENARPEELDVGQWVEFVKAL